MVFEDVNGNQTQDAAEPGIEGVTVYLDANNNRLLDTGEVSTASGADGSYAFRDLGAGDYTVRQVVPNDFRQTTPTGPDRLFGTISGGDHSVAEIDPQDGTLLNQFVLPNPASQFRQGMAFDGETLFFFEHEEKIFYELDPNTGAVLDSTSLSSEFANRNIGGLAALNGLVYMLDTTSNASRALIAFDPETNQLGAIVDLGGVRNYEDGFGALPSENLLIASLESATSPGRLVFLDPDTGDIVDRASQENSRTSVSGITALGDEIFVTYSGFPTEVVDREGNFIRSFDGPFESGSLAGGTGLGGAYLVSLDGVDDVMDVNFGNQTTLGSITGTKFEDVNGNGIQDAGENGLAGVTIYLDLNANGDLDVNDISTMTATDGSYAFTNLTAADYRVREVLPDGYRRTTQGNDAGTYYGAAYIIGGRGRTNYVEIDGLTGQVNRIGNPYPFSDALHGLIRTNSGEIYGLNGQNSDRIFRLDPADGSLTLVGLTDYEMTFGLTYDPLTDTIYGVGKPTATDNLNYLLEVDRDDGSVTQIGPGYEGLVATSGLAFDAATRRVIAFDNQDDEFVAFDLDGHATQNADLGGMNALSLTHTPGGLIFGGLGTALDGQGNILRETLRRVDLESGTRTTILSLSEAAPLESLDWANDPSQYRFLLEAGESVDGVHFGNQRAGGEIRGSVFEDPNENGVQETGETGLAGVTVYVDLNDNGVLDQGEFAANSTVDGTYALTNLPPGDYTVREVVPRGFRQTGPSQNAHSVTLAVDQVASGWDFGNVETNKPPVADAGPTYAFDEGSGVTLDAGLSSDPNQDALTYRWDLNNDGVFADAEGQIVNLTWPQLRDEFGISDDGIYPIAVEVRDGEFSDTDETYLAVRTAAPSNIRLTADPAQIDENGSTTLIGTFEDPGDADDHTVEIRWGDGSSTTIELLNGERSFSADHQYAEDGSYTVSAVITDDDNRQAYSGDNVFDTVVMDFDQFLHTENGISIPTVTEDGFFLDYPDHEFAVFHVPGALHSAYTGTPSMAPTFEGQNIELVHADGLPFNVVSIDLSELINADRPATVTFEGEKTDGSFVTQTFTADDGVFGMETFEFSSAFQNLAALRWSSGLTSDNTIHQFDNIVLQTAATEMTAPVVKVDNVAPRAINLSFAPIRINENGTATLSGTFEDPGETDTHTVVIDWGDGETDTLELTRGQRDFALDHQYLDDGNFSVTATVGDDDGGKREEAVSFVVNNVPPHSLNFTLSPETLSENGTTTLAGGFADPGTEDTHTVLITWGDGRSDTINLTPGQRDFNFDHQYLDNGNYTVTVNVTDEDGLGETQIGNLPVSNIAPSITDISLTPTTIDEDGAPRLSVAFDDPGSVDTHSVVIQWGDGTTNQLELTNGERNFDINHKYLDDGNYNIIIDVEDDDGEKDTGFVDVAVSNVVPSNLNLMLTPDAIDENGKTTLSGTFADPGTLDTHTVFVQWGDGTSSELELPVGRRSFSLDHTYLDDGVFTVTVFVADEDGPAVEVEETITVANVVPFDLNFTMSPDAIEENGDTSLSGTFADPGTLDGHTVVIDWGDGEIETLDLTGGERSFSLAHRYLDDGEYLVAVSVTDESGEGDSGTQTLFVNNIAPEVLSLNTSSSELTASLSGTFSDPGTLDTHTAVIDWGDGTSTEAAITGNTFDAAHTYAVSGTYDVQVTLTDDDGGRDLTDTTVSVAAPLVTGVRLLDGVLQIIGTEGDDNVSLTLHRKHGARVKANFLSGPGESVNPELITSIEVYLLGGNDRFAIDDSFTQPLLVVGGPGDDRISSGGGRSLIVGGPGADRLRGGVKQDILISGMTAFDDDPAALRAILSEWASSRTLEERVQNLSDGSGTIEQKNSSHFLTSGPGGTVHDDNDRDTIRTSGGQDWIFYEPNEDRVHGKLRDAIFANDLDGLLGRL